jgi:hypothetical protein
MIILVSRFPYYYTVLLYTYVYYMYSYFIHDKYRSCEQNIAGIVIYRLAENFQLSSHFVPNVRKELLKKKHAWFEYKMSDLKTYFTYLKDVILRGWFDDFTYIVCRKWNRIILSTFKRSRKNVYKASSFVPWLDSTKLKITKLTSRKNNLFLWNYFVGKFVSWHVYVIVKTLCDIGIQSAISKRRS